METVGTLPRLLLIADGFTQSAVAERVLKAASAGIPWIQLRDHAADSAVFDSAADELLAALSKRTDPPLVSVNSRIGFAESRGMAFHTGRHGPSVADATDRLGPGATVGASVHSAAEARRARSEGARYVTFSPVYPTASKPGHPGQGLDRLTNTVRIMAPVPVLALGGITPDRSRACLEAGAYGMAVVRGILDADDIERAVRLYSDSTSQA